MVKKFSESFKKRLVTEYKTNEQSMSEIAREYGISLSALNRWVHDSNINQPAESPIDSTEVAKLRDEINQLRIKLSTMESELAKAKPELNRLTHELNASNNQVNDLESQLTKDQELIAKITEERDVIKKAFKILNDK